MVFHFGQHWLASAVAQQPFSNRIVVFATIFEELEELEHWRYIGGSETSAEHIAVTWLGRVSS
jgi:hypothetical protein